MTKVYLVTSYDPDIDWGDSLFIEGVFDSNSKALDYINSRNSNHEFEITSMTLNAPESDKPKDNSFIPYPLAYYAE